MFAVIHSSTGRRTACTPWSQCLGRHPQCSFCPCPLSLGLRLGPYGWAVQWGSRATPHTWTELGNCKIQLLFPPRSIKGIWDYYRISSLGAQRRTVCNATEGSKADREREQKVKAKEREGGRGGENCLSPWDRPCLKSEQPWTPQLWEQPIPWVTSADFESRLELLH